MPVLARWMIKAALAYLVTALILGLLVTAGPQLGLPSSIGVFRPVYLHLLMVGWVTQLIFGVVYWMFPKYSRERPRGNEQLGWLIFWLLNAGLILRVIGEPLAVLVPGEAAGWLLGASALLQFGAGWAFVANTWGRVKER